jgi:integrase
MAFLLHQSLVRNRLQPRREPYWGPPLAKGQHVGLRKITATTAAWIARYRDDDGQRHYKALGFDTAEFNHERATEAAKQFFKVKADGIKTDEVLTVADACRAYVKERRVSKSEACAHDAEKRFERTVYEADFGRQSLAKLRAAKVREWRDKLKLGPAAANRTLTALKAALNLAVRERHVSGSVAIEWKDVKPLPGGNKRRDLYLHLPQRRALLKAAKGAIRDLIEGVILTGSRAGELVNATVSQFDARTKSMTFTGKTGTRTVPISAPAVTLFKRLAEKKAPTDRLFVRDDGQPWAHSDWDELVRDAAAAAELPAGTCLYTLRHSWVTTALTKGMTTLDVARLVGTSVMMIEKFYGHLVASAARQRLAKVAML